MQEIEIDILSDNNKEWKKIMGKALETASHFEIHIWNEEEEELSKALKYGSLKDNTWRFGKVIEGKVTEEFKSFILNSEKPLDTEIYNKMTPFFSIFLDNGFASEHYGTELYKKQEI